jgi:hypothetical protein
MCDIIFHTDQSEIPAHRFILITSSPVFYTHLTEAESI